MRFRKSGKIINISSMAGKVWTPFGAWYHATKFAVEGFSDALRLEVEPFGIKVVVIEPGAIESNWGDITIQNLQNTSGDGAYKETVARQVANFQNMYHNSRFLTKADKIAEVITKASFSRHPRTRYLTGFGAKPSVVLAHLVPNRVFNKISRKFM